MLVLEANMDTLLARERLRERGHELTAESLRQTVLEITGDQLVADQAYCDRVLADSRGGHD